MQSLALLLKTELGSFGLEKLDIGSAKKIVQANRIVMDNSSATFKQRQLTQDIISEKIDSVIAVVQKSEPGWHLILNKLLCCNIIIY